MEGYGWFGTAYFMYDIWSMYQVHTQKIADKLKLMKLTSSASFTPKPLVGQSNGGLYDKHIARTFNTSGQRLVALDDEFANDLDVSEDMQHVRHHEDEIYDYDGETVQIPENGKWGFLKYVFTHPVMMIHHIFVGTVGFLVVTVSIQIKYVFLYLFLFLITLLLFLCSTCAAVVIAFTATCL